jgi:hypothetical protein
MRRFVGSPTTLSTVKGTVLSSLPRNGEELPASVVKPSRDDLAIASSGWDSCIYWNETQILAHGYAWRRLGTR